METNRGCIQVQLVKLRGVFQTVKNLGIIIIMIRAKLRGIFYISLFILTSETFFLMYFKLRVKSNYEE